MGLEPTQNPTIQETLEEMGEIEKEEEIIEVNDAPKRAKAEFIEEPIKKAEPNVVLPATVEESSSVPTIREADILNPNYGMDVKIEVATHVANILSNVLEKQDLVLYGLNKSNKEKGYVTVEGWNTLGTMLGITPITECVVPFQTKAKYGYKARVSLYQNAIIENGKLVSGTLLATAEAIATSAGFQKNEPDVYSMAQTRALGKVYRMALSWIMKLAGFEPTPAEEMPSYQ